MPVYVSNNTNLTTAISIMLLNDYSQLPVTNNGTRGLCGFLSWKTIGAALVHGEKSTVVKDYKELSVPVISPETSLLDAISIIVKNDFAVVEKSGELVGIVTTADISEEFVSITEPYILIGEIENSLRNILNGAQILLDTLKKKCQTEGDIDSLDDLTFYNYIELLSDDEVWNKVGIIGDKKEVCHRLDEIREIRNEVMHSRLDSLCGNDIGKLRNFVGFLLNELNRRN